MVNILVLLIIAGLILIIILLYKKEKTENVDLQKLIELNRQQELRISELINQQLQNQQMSTSNEMHNVLSSIDAKITMGHDSFDRKVSNQNYEMEGKIQATIANLEQKINWQSKQANEQVSDLASKITKIDQVQGQILGLNENIVALEKTLNDKQLRGAFGEARLLQIFASNFGENSELYEQQYTLSNGKRADFILHGPSSLGDIVVDSKFPLDNYHRIGKAANEDELNKSRREFQKDVKKHINDIATKYIIPGETAAQAIMFIPSEAVYYEILANHEGIIDYSYQNAVWISSPTTLMALLNQLIVVLNDLRRNEYSKEIHQELIKLSDEFTRYEKRMGEMTKHMEMLARDVHQVNITGDKITRRFEQIKKVDFQ